MQNELINNDLYHELGERWYTANNDPVAILRSEARLHVPWINAELKKAQLSKAKILDVGCGGGFLSNPLSSLGHQVTGVDISEESLTVAKKYDKSGRVNYLCADARKIPLEEPFDAVICMDFLEHVKEYDQVISEVSRLLKPGGLFFFHTFNRTMRAKIVIIKSLEWFIKNTPKNLHIASLFIKPKELENVMNRCGLDQKFLTGIRPVLNWGLLKSLITGNVSPNFNFCFTKDTSMSYSGVAIKRSLS